MFYNKTFRLSDIPWRLRDNVQGSDDAFKLGTWCIVWCTAMAQHDTLVWTLVVAGSQVHPFRRFFEKLVRNAGDVRQISGPPFIIWTVSEMYRTGHPTLAASAASAMLAGVLLRPDNDWAKAGACLRRTTSIKRTKTIHGVCMGLSSAMNLFVWGGKDVLVVATAAAMVCRLL